MTETPADPAPDVTDGPITNPVPEPWAEELDDDLLWPVGTAEEGLRRFDQLAVETEDASAFKADSGLFPGDNGTLPAKARAVLARFLSRPMLDADAGPTQKAEWEDLLAYRTVIASQLNNMYLALHVDERHRVAWKEQIELDGHTVPRLIVGTGMSKWSIQAVLLMVWLRSELHRQTVEGGSPRAYVHREEMLSHMLGARPVGARDEAAYRRACEKAMDSLVGFGLIDNGRRGGDRYRISGAVAVLFTVDRMRELLATYFHTVSTGPALAEVPADPADETTTQEPTA